MRPTRRYGLLAAMILAAAATACDRQPGLDVRTFPLTHLRPGQAHELILPYVYADRAGAPGVATASDGALTVRETPDNLDKIERVLAEFDVPRPDVRLHFQLIEADGFTTSDPRIAAVEEELRKIFQFGGYRLAGEAVVFATDGAAFGQSLRAGSESYSLRGLVARQSQDAIRLEAIELCCAGGAQLETSIVIRPGQTVVVGSSPAGGETATLLLTVRAEEVPPGPA